MADETGRSRAFLRARRKGHPLRAASRRRYSNTLLPRPRSSNLTGPAAGRQPSLFPEPVDDVRASRSDSAVASTSLNRGRGTHPAPPASIGAEPFRQRHGEGTGLPLPRGTSRTSGSHHGDATELVAWLPPGLARAAFDLIYSPTPGRNAGHWKRRFRAGPKRRRDRPYPAAGR